MPSEIDRQLARSAELLNRVSSRNVRRRAHSAVRRGKRAVKYSLTGIVVVLIAAIVWGFVAPLGFGGLVSIFFALVAAVIIGILLSAERPVDVTTLTQVPLKALPASTDRWLDTQRLALPAPAVPLLDSIGVRLESLAPQLARLDEKQPEALEIRRLLSDHLPDLVAGYQSIPQDLRRQNRNGRVPDEQLVEGLKVIDQEIGLMSEQLASGDLDRLATQKRYLELKYQEVKDIQG
jgi:hypothetical protein